MDPTLRAILAELYQSHVLIDQLRARVAELERQAERITAPQDDRELQALFGGPAAPD